MLVLSRYIQPHVYLLSSCWWIPGLFFHEVVIEQVVIEPTGLADPQPIIATLCLSPDLQEDLVLDGVITLVDAKHIEQHLDEKKPEGALNEAEDQIAYADRILLNKTDLVRFADCSLLIKTELMEFVDCVLLKTTDLVRLLFQVPVCIWKSISLCMQNTCLSLSERICI